MKKMNMNLSLSFKLVACPLFFQGIDVLKELFYRKIRKWVKVCFPEAAGTVLDFCLLVCFCPSLLSLVKKLIQLIKRNVFFTCIFMYSMK